PKKFIEQHELIKMQKLTHELIFAALFSGDFLTAQKTFLDINLPIFCYNVLSFGVTPDKLTHFAFTPMAQCLTALLSVGKTEEALSFLTTVCEQNLPLDNSKFTNPTRQIQFDAFKACSIGVFISGLIAKGDLNKAKESLVLFKSYFSSQE